MSALPRNQTRCVESRNPGPISPEYGTPLIRQSSFQTSSSDSLMRWALPVMVLPLYRRLFVMATSQIRMTTVTEHCLSEGHVSRTEVLS